MNKELTPLEAFQLFCKELKIENSEFANAIEGALKDYVVSKAKIRELENNIEYLHDTLEMYDRNFGTDVFKVTDIDKKLKAFEFIKNNDYLRNFIKNWAYDYDEVNDTNLFETFNEVLKDE